MSDNGSWTDQWFKAQQQFVDAWSEMARAGTAGETPSQADLWAQGFDLWRKACSGEQTQPDIQQALNKCFDMGKSYYAMAEQVSKGLADGNDPVEAINAWMEQLKQALSLGAASPGFDTSNFGDFMQQWFAPSSAWQQLSSMLLPMSQAAWQSPGMNTSVFNFGEATDPLGKILQAPGIGYFREPQEKQQRGIQLALEYNEANFRFNQAFLRVAIESIQDFQQHLLKLDQNDVPGSLRELYDLWVEVSESHYAEFAMSDEYQELYGDMVNRLMILRKHYGEIVDDWLGAMNLPNTREVDTMQQRLQQLRRENIALRQELKEIKSLLDKLVSQPAVKKTRARKAAKPAVAKKAPARKQAAKRKTAAKKSKSRG